MKYSNIVIDANNLFWRSVSIAINKFITFEEFPLYVGGIQTFLNRVKQLQETYGRKDSQIYFLFDNPFSKINLRKIITEGKYKHPRKSKQIPEQVYKSLMILIEVLKNYSDNYHIAQAASLEADDLTLPLSQHLEDKKILFISADLDWARNITETQHWYNYDLVYNIKNFEKQYGFEPTGNKIKMFKTIRGDASDAIEPGLPHMGIELVRYIVNTYNDLDDLMHGLHVDTTINNDWKRKIEASISQLRVNYQLVDFIPVAKPISESLLHCKRVPAQANIWHKVLQLPIEPWMQSKQERKKSFLKKQKIRVF